MVLRRSVHAIQHSALLVGREPEDITMENRAEGIACDEIPPSGLRVRRQPCRKAAQPRHDDAVVSRDQREYSSRGQSVVDEGAQISGGQELRILPVYRSRKAVGCASGRR